MEYGYIVKYYNDNKKALGKRFNGIFKEALKVARVEAREDKKCIGFKIFNERKNELHSELKSK